MTYGLKRLLARTRNFWRDRQSRIQTIIVLFALITIPAFAFAVQHPTFLRPKADLSGVQVYLAPTTASVPPDKTLQLMANAQTNQAAFIQTEVVFDPAKVQLVQAPLLGTALKKIIFQTELAEANRTGRLKLAVGLDPADKAQAPTQSFLIASLIFKSATTTTNQSASVAISADRTRLVTLDERELAPAVGNATLAVNQVVASPSPATGSQPSISRIVMVNTATKADIQTLNTSQPITINYTQFPKFTLKAVTAPETVGSVKFVYKADYRAQANPAVIDNNLPYTMVCDGGKGNWICPWDVGVGTYTVSVTPYSDGKARGTAGTTLTFTIRIVDNTTAAAPTAVPSPSPTLSVQRVDMINGATGALIKTLNTDSLTTLKLSDYPKYTLKAVTSPETSGSVKFVYKADYRAEANPAVIDNNLPYTIVCDGGSAGWICPWDVGVGLYDISMTPYPQANAQGVAGSTLNFSIKVE
jgi:hypothetical protein